MARLLDQERGDFAMSKKYFNRMLEAEPDEMIRMFRPEDIHVVVTGGETGAMWNRWISTALFGVLCKATPSKWGGARNRIRTNGSACSAHRSRR